MKSPNDYNWDFQLIGRRFSHRRRQLGLTIDEVAQAAQVSRFTLMRIEKGHRTKTGTVHRIRKCLRLYSDQLSIRDHESDRFEVHRQEKTRWMISVPKRDYSKEEGSQSIHVDDDQERHRLGQLGFQPFYTAILQCELPEGTSGHAFMELHQSSWTDAHYGEEFVYAIRGSSTITVDGDTCVLREGDAMCFDARQPHSYAPSEPVEVGQHAPQILIVVTSRPYDQELGAVERPLPRPSTKR